MRSAGHWISAGRCALLARCCAGPASAERAPGSTNSVPCQNRGAAAGPGSLLLFVLRCTTGEALFSGSFTQGPLSPHRRRVCSPSLLPLLCRSPTCPTAFTASSPASACVQPASQITGSIGRPGRPSTGRSAEPPGHCLAVPCFRPACMLRRDGRWAGCSCTHTPQAWARARAHTDTHTRRHTHTNTHTRARTHAGQVPVLGPDRLPPQVLQKTGGEPAAAGGQQEAAGRAGEGSAGGRSAPDDDVIVGPWMDSWPLTHSNRHVEAWLAGKRATTKA